MPISEHWFVTAPCFSQQTLTSPKKALGRGRRKIDSGKPFSPMLLVRHPTSVKVHCRGCTTGCGVRRDKDGQDDCRYTGHPA